MFVWDFRLFFLPVLSEEEFQQLQQNFMEKHYLEFEDSEENKLSYTQIFNKYVRRLPPIHPFSLSHTPIHTVSHLMSFPD